MNNTIHTNELRRLRSMKSELLLVDVLPKDAFDKDHIEGAINAPLDGADFLATVEKAAGRKDKKIVVYCSGVGCDASGKAATKLKAAGYSDVTTYEGGVSGWRKDAVEPGHAAAGAGVGGAAAPAPLSADKPAPSSWSSGHGNKTEPATKPVTPEPAGAGSSTAVGGKPAPDSKK